MFSPKNLSRYLLIAFLTGLLITIAIPYFSHSSVQSQEIAPSNKVSNPTAIENQNPGTTDWQLTNPATKREIEGYASLTSVNLDGKISLFVNTADPNYTIEIFRMGWYNGKGGRRITDPITQPGIKQPRPIENKDSGLIECNWKNPYILTIPHNWVSGVYLAKLTTSKKGKQSYIIFVVRDDARKSNYLFQSSVTTFQAYNNWGGKSLYKWNSQGKQAYEVSFNRPYAASPNPAAAYGVGAGEFLTNLQPKRRTFSSGWEYNMVRWLEKEGYDVTYATDIDTHADPQLLLSHKAFLVVGHDEYWSWEMRQNVEAARDKGVSLGFFSGNTCYWQIRLDLSRITEDLNRTIVAYKEMAALDPFGRDHDPSNDNRVTAKWRSKQVNRPEDALIGVMYQTFQVNSNIVIDNAPDWLIKDTGLHSGNILPGLLGYEVDRISQHSPSNIIRVAHSPFSYKGCTRYSDMTVYQAASGAIVFATGSIQWSWGLDNYNSPQLRPSILNPAAQQITRNVLARLAVKDEI